MPYNGSGTFTLPAGNPVVTGTTISSVTTNATNSDIANGLSNAVTRNGQSLPTANLPMGNFKLTGLAAGAGAGESVNYDQAALKTSSTGSVILPSGTVLQRDTLPLVGYIRFNTTYNTYEGVVITAGVTITSINRVNTLATVVTATNHGRATLDAIVISGATDSLYNGEYSITVLSPTSFTYVMAGIPAVSPATGTIVYSCYIWGSIGGGATGASNDHVFYENSQAITASYSITSSKSAMSTGPITIGGGVIITVPTGSRWVVL
jgi:hypothetical protein